MLQGFHNAPQWVNIIANAMVLVHMVSAYQVFGQVGGSGNKADEIEGKERRAKGEYGRGRPLISCR